MWGKILYIGLFTTAFLLAITDPQWLRAWWNVVYITLWALTFYQALRLQGRIFLGAPSYFFRVPIEHREYVWATLFLFLQWLYINILFITGNLTGQTAFWVELVAFIAISFVWIIYSGHAVFGFLALCLAIRTLGHFMINIGELNLLTHTELNGITYYFETLGVSGLLGWEKYKVKEAPSG